MGCCLSSTTDPKSKNPDDTPPPPPPVLEEETVKEVLTETPIISKPPTTTPTLSQTQSNKHPIIQEPDPTPKPELPTKPPVETFSDVSELCSYTESYSTTLTALTEKRDENDDEDDGEVTQRVVNRTSPAPKLPRKRHSAPATGEHLRNKDRGLRSPARRSLPSPEKKAQVASRSVPSRNTAQQRRNVGPPPNVMRRDNTADGPRRRSRSPATRGEVGVGPRRNGRNQTPSSTLADRPGGQTPAPASKLENAEGKLDMREKSDDAVTPEPRESLDNPLVSLECFIFL